MDHTVLLQKGRGSDSFSVVMMHLPYKQMSKIQIQLTKAKYLQFTFFENDLYYNHKPVNTRAIAMLHPSGFIVLSYNLAIVLLL